MQNYQLEVCVISMEFLAVNRRRLSHETPLGAGSDERRLYSQASKENNLQQAHLCVTVSITKKKV